tara:strand:+ start:165 stop:515 length:351 start_codon:yes stop_codon:yes gene_type:complete
MATKKEVLSTVEPKVAHARIISVRVYQAVTFDSASETSFIVDGTQRRKPVSVEIIGNYAGIEIKSKTDHIFVPMTNVSGIYFENAKSLKKVSEAKVESEKIKAINSSKTDQSTRPR